MKRLLVFALFLAGASMAHAQFTPPANLAYCLNPSGNWIPLSSLGASVGFTPTAIGLYGQNGSSYAPIQCDANGNLIISGSSVATAGLIYASTNCGALPSTSCVTVPGYALIETGCTAVSGQPQVTCPNASFTNADIGKLGFGTTDLDVGTAIFGTYTAATPTISSVQSGTQATMSANALASAPGTLYFVHGPDDTAAMDTFTSMVTTACTGGVLPVGNLIVTHAEFYGSSGCPNASIFQSPTWTAQYPNTYIFLPPPFDFSTCSHGNSGLACFFGQNGGFINGFHFSGVGYQGTSTISAHNLIEMGDGMRMYNTGGIGFFSASTTHIVGIADYSLQGIIQDSGSNYFGSVAFQCDTPGCESFGTEYTGQFSAIQVTANNFMWSHLDTIYGGSGVTESTALVGVLTGGTFICAGCQTNPAAASESFHISNAILQCNNNAIIKGGVYAIDLGGTTGGVQMQGCAVTSGSTSIFETTSGTTVNDLGGNTFTTTHGVLSTGVSGYAQGSGSVNTTAMPGSDFALTSGFGTSGTPTCTGFATRLTCTITLAGSPTTGAVANVTFPTTTGGFMAPPICTHSEGGTQLLTNVTLGTPTVTGVSITYTGVLAAANTIVETLNCSN